MSEPEGLHARALDRLDAGDLAGGVADLEAWLAQDPGDAAAWLDLGAAWIALDRPADAAAALARAIAIAPDDRDARRLHARASYALGLAHEARRDPGAAIAAFREALRSDPAHLDARRVLADTLAALGEHAAAIAEFDALLAIAPGDAQAAHNRAVLARALDHLVAQRLLGKDARALALSALVECGGLRPKGPVATPLTPTAARTERHAAPLIELDIAFDAHAAIDALLLVLPDPARAARAEDDAFRVTVVARDGRRAPADLATAASLTFLREALGCPLTDAGALYSRLIAGEPEIRWGGAIARWTSLPHPDRPGDHRHGLLVTLQSLSR